MRDRGKAVASYNNNNNNNNYSSSTTASTSDLVLCRKHPSSSSVGICAYCLKDRLVKLVCSDCGEQRLSSCSCSEISSNRNSCTVEVGSVGRVSFLIENEKSSSAADSLLLTPNQKPTHQPQIATEHRASDFEEDGFLPTKNGDAKRVSSSSSGGFWKIGKLFGKKKEKTKGGGGFDNGGSDDDDDDDDDERGSKNETWVLGNGVVSRSRSLCSLRGEESGAGRDLHLNLNVRGAAGSEPRKSREFVKPEPGFDLKGANRRVFSLREGDSVGETGFIDLKFGLPAPKNFRSNSSCGFADRRGSFGSLVTAGIRGEGVFADGGSCRITVNDKGVRKGRKSTKVWRWIFRGNSSRKEEGQRSQH